MDIMGKAPIANDALRHRIMSRIKSKNTKIEIFLRKALWGSGLRYRKNYAKLPGAPDIAITKHRIAIFCDGEFWHGKNWTVQKTKIKSNREYWIAKIERNINRDCEAYRRLNGMGWTVVRFWGEEITKHLDECVEEIKSIIFQNKIGTDDGYWEFDEP
jgi:DNA mismatch endonuclease (patch repair protein)